MAISKKYKPSHFNRRSSVHILLMGESAPFLKSTLLLIKKSFTSPSFTNGEISDTLGFRYFCSKRIKIQNPKNPILVLIFRRNNSKAKSFEKSIF